MKLILSKYADFIQSASDTGNDWLIPEESEQAWNQARWLVREKVNHTSTEIGALSGEEGTREFGAMRFRQCV